MATTTRTQQEPGLVTGLFTDKDSSERAYETLRARGYTDDEIDVIMSEETRNKYYANDPHSELGNKAAEGAGVGGAIGAGLGAVIGGIAAIGTNLVLPGIGLVVWGPIAAALAGAGAGGITGGLAGALIGMGIPEDRAQQIADAFGLFGSPERCADCLLRAREEAGVQDVFLFPAHDLAGGYHMPEAEVEAFELSLIHI